MRPRAVSPPPRRVPWLLGLLVVLVILGGLLLRYVWLTPSPPPEAPRQLRTVTLYFAGADGSGLVAETREIVDCQKEQDCLITVVQALVDGPAGKLAPVLPPQAALRGVAVTGNELQIDFARSLIEAYSGGSWGELLTIHALANTIAANFPHLRQVRILVDGAAIETLKGHVDLRLPINPDFSLVRNAPVGPTVTTPVGRLQ